MVFLVPLSKLTSIPTWAQDIYHIWAFPGHEMEEKEAKNGIFTIKDICDYLFNGTMLKQGWNGTDGIQADQFAHLPDPECPQ